MKKNGLLIVVILLSLSIGAFYLFKPSMAAENSLYSDDYLEVGENGKVTELKITRRLTGTAPFDNDNNPGNDKDEDNNIVRSFDQIIWELEATFGLKDEDDLSLYYGGVIKIEGEVSGFANLVNWDLSSMKWLENATVSSDGQTFLGYYKLAENELSLPGKQTVSPVLKVLGATNNSEIKAKFKVSLYGNNANEGKSVTDNAVKVSAAPKYNIELANNQGLANKVTVNFGNGDVTGRMYGFAYTIALYNETADKGLKGIEYPKGDITFDFDLKLERSKFNSTELDDITSLCTPLLWNYKKNIETNTGNIPGRSMVFSNPGGERMYTNFPGGDKEVNRERTVYNSGNIEMKQSGSRISVKVADYELDGIFPTKPFATWINNLIYTKNIGVFHVGYLQVFVPENSESTVGDRNYYFTVSDSNLKMKSITGVNVHNQMNSNDDVCRVNHVLYNPGSFTQAHSIMNNQTNGYLSSDYYSGDARASIGQTFQFASRFMFNGTGDIGDLQSGTKFIKFDADAVEPVLYSDKSKYQLFRFDGDMTFNVWYITKQDGKNWVSQEEMNNAKIENMVFYDTIEDIPDSHLCVGVYFESINGKLAKSSSNNNMVLIKLKVKNSAKIGKTYGFTAVTSFWEEYVDRTKYTITKKNFAEWPAPLAEIGYLNYIKTEYGDDGTIISGTNNGGWIWGQSLLIVGADLKINKVSIDDNSQTKNNYDLGKGETIVTYKLTPSITNTALTGKIDGVKLKIVDTIPKGITYKNGTSNYGEPTITNNSDGTTTLTWIINNCEVNKPINPIVYQADIDEFSNNGKSYTSKVIVSEIIENNISKIGNTIEQFRTSQNTINIINLSSYSIYKKTDTPIIEKDDIAHFTLTAVNGSDYDVNDFKLLDVLPYNLDVRGSKYHGNYQITKINYHLVNENNEEINNNLRLYLTEYAKAKTDINVKDSDIGTGTIWSTGSNNGNINKALTAFALRGTLPRKAKLHVDIYMKTTDNMARDVYANNVAMETNIETKEIVSANVKVEVVERIITGTIWEDKNKDGLFNNNEKTLSNIDVILLTATGTELLRTKSDSDGKYIFNDLPKGNYRVRIEYDDYYRLTYAFVGEDDIINSKFTRDRTKVLTKLNSNEESIIKEENINAGLIPKETKVIINYYNKLTGQLIEKEEDTGFIGDEYTGTAKNFNKLFLIERPEKETITLIDGDNILNYYYIPVSGGVIEKHLDEYDNSVLDNDEYKGNVGDRYSTNSKNFDGYKLVEEKLPNNASGTMKEELIEVIYYYKKQSKVIIKYIDELTGEEISQKIEKSGYVGDDYTSNPKEIPGYKLVVEPANKNGKFNHEDTEVIYYYRKVVNVTTKVNGTGGTITGDEEVYVGNNSTPENIVITPDKNHYIKKITINGEEIEITDKSGMILEHFINMQEDKLVEVEFGEIIKNVPKTDMNSILPIIAGVILVIGIGLLVFSKKIFK